ncbi:hypothetical protein C0989_001742 [Termitomyces sp. Mn162]|nr:hypothetical protein C0989_001742 [Termitomyces sp. Mn162]
MGMGAGVVLQKAKGKMTVLLEEQQAFKEKQEVKTVASNKEKESKDVEMAESTPVVTVAEVEIAASGEVVEGEREVEEEAMEVEKDKSDKEAKTQQQGTWSHTLL